MLGNFFNFFLEEMLVNLVVPLYYIKYLTETLRKTDLKIRGQHHLRKRGAWVLSLTMASIS